MQSESNVKVTIIVPVHNSERYLQQCLESALAQTLREIEILCIDSSKSDRCAQIIADMKDNRITYVKDPDSSYGYKINTGIKMAKGEYVAILETDDQMFPDMVEKLYSAGELYHVDMVNADYCEFFDCKGGKFWEEFKLYNSFPVYDHLMSCTAKTCTDTVTGNNDREFGVKFSNRSANGENDAEYYTISADHLWTALYRKSFLLTHNIRLNESPGASYQDASFIFLTGLLAKSVYHLDEPLYWYRTDNAGSSVNDNQKIFEMADEHQFLKRELEKRNVKDVGVWNLFYYRKYKAFHWNYLRLPEKARELFLKRYLEELQSDIAAGVVRREMCDRALYQWTFLLMDDLEKFKAILAEERQHRSFMTMPEILNRLEGRDVVVFGAGMWGRKVLDVLRQNENRIVKICDNAEKLHGTTLAGVEIGPVAETTKRFPNACYLIVSRGRSDEMRAHLLAEGIPEGNIEIFR